MSRYTKSMVVAPTGRTQLTETGKWIVEEGHEFVTYK